jgi:hypothetical protein
MHDAPVAHNHEGGAGRAGAPQLGLDLRVDRVETPVDDDLRSVRGIRAARPAARHRNGEEDERQ